MNKETPIPSKNPLDSRLLPWLAFSLLLAAFNFIFKPFFPLVDFRLGHDYSYVLPNLFDGLIWFRNNGLDIPWFSPSFCAGQPFFADPQSSYYALPQFLTFLVPPLTAIYWTLLIGVSLMFWGGYLLMRRVFRTSMITAVLIGGLLMFNGFLPHRVLVGHLGYHAFALVPWIALLLLAPARKAVDGIAAAGVAGLMLAYWVHAGFGTLILAGILAILSIALTHALSGGIFSRFVARGILAVVIGFGLSAAKLWASLSFMSHFSRTYYLLPGAATIHDALVMIGGALFLPSQWAYTVGMPRLVNVQWGLSPHEWAFNFSGVVAVLFIVLGVSGLRQRRWSWNTTPSQAVCWTILLLVLIWPVAFNTWHPSWNAFLKTMPILGSASSPVRWLIVYIPIVAVGLGLLLESAQWGRVGTLVAAVGLIATVGQSALEPREYYLSQGYDARPILIADSLLRAGKLAPKINSLGTSASIRVDHDDLQLVRNDTLVAGVSQVFCYNPSFGYRLEKFSANELVPGAVLAEQKGFLNLKNPACYVFPEENNCRPSDRFHASQREQVKAFVEYRPYAFVISRGQIIANRVTFWSSIIVGTTLLAWLLKALATGMWCFIDRRYSNTNPGKGGLH